MLQYLKQHIEKNLSFITGKNLLLAVSGGIDSMVLVDLFSKLDFKLGIAHCNFQLREEESNGDEEFVKTQSKKYTIKGHYKSFDTKNYSEEKKISIQQAARELRYNWFNELLEKEGYDFLLTAHHLDDSLETFLINFTRGTGIEGLTGIPEVNRNVIRPLLIFSRDEIENYAKENKIEWREDSSNASDKYFRNKIRHHVIPILKELNPSLLESFENTIKNISGTNTLVKDALNTNFKVIATQKNSETYFDIEKLVQLENYKSYLYEWLKSFGFSDWQSIYELIHSQSGKQIFSENYRLLKDRNQLILSEIGINNNEESFSINENENSIVKPINLSICNQSYISEPTKSCIFVNKEKLKFPLKIRKWQEGDYFYPSGMQGKKKVSKYFKDEKFSLIDKENTWLLCSNNEVIWIINHRADQRFLANNNTQQILKIELQ
ncbi:tRNA lysidine(34) synthetase TilS [Flavobacterium terrae]|uniref:tRNA(Ile)-lysidine synthase n=1 Tax=Flavobacterium terrae TaxID=415425 RepID=A0A1M6EV10_9FLAO|nr:tRNA lysidine(34) synthetase TilS [Flavobacterium terrae]SHI89304.1 tRNA(Ile)-lysidine synthase [Flavobacterium terrae]